jgi:hypothetical protein
MNISHNQPEARIAVIDMVLPIGSIDRLSDMSRQNIVTVEQPPHRNKPKIL